VPGKSPVKMQPVILDIFFLGELHTVCMYRGQVSLRVVNVPWTHLDPLAFILHLLNQFWIAVMFVCSSYEAVAGSLSVASSAVSSTKVTVVDSGEVGRSVVYSRYNSIWV
jgi:hypothetical protein